MKKSSPKYESGNANKVKNESKFNVDEYQDAIKYLKEYCDIDDINHHENKRLCVKHVIKHLQKNFFWKNIFRKSTLTCCETIVTKCLNE